MKKEAAKKQQQNGWKCKGHLLTVSYLERHSQTIYYTYVIPFGEKGLREKATKLNFNVTTTTVI